MIPANGPLVTVAVDLSLPVSPALVRALAALESLCFDRPWGIDEIDSTLAQSGSALTYVATSAEATAADFALVAYCICQRVEDEVEILQIATHPEARRRGLGQKLLARVLADLEKTGTAETSIFLEVRRSNVAAIALYQQAGFRPCGVRRGYYAPTKAHPFVEDALLFQLEFGKKSPADKA